MKLMILVKQKDYKCLPSTERMLLWRALSPQTGDSGEVYQWIPEETIVPMENIWCITNNKPQINQDIECHQEKGSCGRSEALRIWGGNWKRLRKAFGRRFRTRFAIVNQKKGLDWEKTDGLQLAWSQSESRPGICFHIQPVLQQVWHNPISEVCKWVWLFSDIHPHPQVAPPFIFSAPLNTLAWGIKGPVEVFSRSQSSTLLSRGVSASAGATPPTWVTVASAPMTTGTAVVLPAHILSSCSLRPWEFCGSPGPSSWCYCHWETLHLPLQPLFPLCPPPYVLAGSPSPVIHSLSGHSTGS